MQTKCILVCLALLPLSGGGDSLARQSLQQPSESPSLALLRERGNALFRSGQYVAAAELYDKGLRDATNKGENFSTVRFLNNSAACSFAAMQYRRAMQRFLEASRVAEEIGDVEGMAETHSNLATIYLHMGEGAAALEEAEKALRFERHSRRIQRHILFLRVATLRAYAGDFRRASPLFRAAVEESRRRRDGATEAACWSQLGYEYVRRGEFGPAEEALWRSLALRRSGRKADVHYSYRNLGLLRMAQGRLQEAGDYLDRAIESARGFPSLAPLWTAYHQRGQVRLRQSEVRSAFEDFGQALELARRWRLEALPADALRVSAAAGRQEIYNSYIEAGARLYFQTGDATLARRTFAAVEENRAAGLREGLRQSWEVSPEYGEALAQLQAAEVALLRKNDAASRERAAGLRRRLMRLELLPGLEASPPAREEETDPVRRIRRMLGHDAALLSFHLGEVESYVWAVTDRNVHLWRAPAAARIAERVREARAVVQNGSGGAPLERLYSELFGRLPEDVERKKDWLLSLDGDLFAAPFPALAAAPGGRREVLAERHTLQLAPGALAVSRGRRTSWAGRFVGIADPVYNRADSRLRRRGAGQGSALELSRLAGSGEEVRACAREWGGDAVLLEGAQASKDRLRGELSAPAAVCHLATHVLRGRRRGSEGLIALTLTPSGAPDFLSAAEVRSWPVRAALVAMAGCRSGEGEIAPGEGLMDLSRAWLLAGARFVVARLWPAPDDTGAFFETFYRHLRRPHATPARALQAAQMEMIGAGGWRSEPRYWAAHFVLGRERD